MVTSLWHLPASVDMKAVSDSGAAACLVAKPLRRCLSTEGSAHLGVTKAFKQKEKMLISNMLRYSHAHNVY